MLYILVYDMDCWCSSVMCMNMLHDAHMQALKRKRSHDNTVPLGMNEVNAL